jgi:hypothetical protein
VIKTIVKIFIEENIVIVMTVYSHKSITSGSGRDHIQTLSHNVVLSTPCDEWVRT